MIRTAKEAVDRAVKEISDIQLKKVRPIRFRYDHLNENTLGGLLPHTIIGIAGSSGSGKSFTSQMLEEDLFDPNLNPHCEDIRLIRCNFEMPVRSLLLRRMSRATDLDIDELLSDVPSDFNKSILKKVADKERSERIFYYSDMVTPEIFEKDMEKFLIEVQNESKEKERKIQTVISVDHMALIEAQTDPKTAIDKLVKSMNKLKIKYDVIFVMISQLNREINKRISNKMEQAPRRDDLYQTDTMYHLADYIIIIHRPEMLGIDEYMWIRPGKYDWIPDCFKWNPTAERTSFKTEGLVFWHYIKLREQTRKRKQTSINIEVLPGYERLYHSRSGGVLIEQQVKEPDNVYIPPDITEEDNLFR